MCAGQKEIAPLYVLTRALGTRANSYPQQKLLCNIGECSFEFEFQKGIRGKEMSAVSSDGGDTRARGCPTSALSSSRSIALSNYWSWCVITHALFYKLRLYRAGLRLAQARRERLQKAGEEARVTHPGLYRTALPHSCRAEYSRAGSQADIKQTPSPWRGGSPGPPGGWCTEAGGACA